ncbi:ammonium transporter [uncultured Ruminococcus sp.]|uniref:ammonium transporter n=1 Tax=uncultured Ruminococcus sp. TaxID=165186 RepID=UPI00260F63E3|nr:ammonium transporter [uncultured Ruminococcus sp.]
MDSGNIGFVMLCAAFVFFMTPGLSCFYGGLVRRKNAVNTMFTSVVTIATGIVMWMLIGYSLSFGPDHGGVIGDFSWFGLEGVSLTEPYVEGQGIPNMVFCLFQMMFAVITPALITGSVAGRMKFKSLFVFLVLWSLVVYYPMAHMVWADGGFLAKIGSVDFAGGNVVHISSGITALTLCILLGKRYDYKRANYKIHNMPMVALGAFILLFGWFGFNAGSALAADGLAAHAFVTTAVSSAAAMLSWMFCDVVVNKKPTFVGACTGMVAGLVGITPGAGFVPIWAALIIGLTTSPICFFMISWVKEKFGYDDALDAFGCHGVGGIWGGICTGLFCKVSINDIGQGNGLFFDDTKLFLMQLASIGITIVVSVAGTLICYGITRLVTGKIRVTEREERVGLDRSQHGESAYPSFNGLD